MTEPLWKPEKFLVAAFEAPYPVDGWTYRSLGMWKAIEQSPKGRRPATWSLTHLGSGHRVCLINAHMAEAFNIATEIAEVTEWDFDSLRGWKDRDPDLPTKMQAFALRFGKKMQMLGGGGNNHEVARMVAEARA